MIYINGMGSRIAQAFLAQMEVEAVALPLPGKMPWNAERFLFCQGYLAGLEARWHQEVSSAKTWERNFLEIAAALDEIFQANDRARVVVIGSESGFRGSFDTAYAGAKAALHLYVETKPLLPGQQLVAISPGIIADAGMTLRRTDTEALAARAAAHPKGRFVTCAEVARLAAFLLYEDLGFITGTVIRMHGGGR